MKLTKNNILIARQFAMYTRVRMGGNGMLEDYRIISINEKGDDLIISYEDETTKTKHRTKTNKKE